MLLNRYELIIKKSRFIGYLYDIKNIDDVEIILKEIKNEHPKASHFPFAYILNNTAKKTDDKEPHNTAGNPIYNILVYNNYNHHLLVVVRYFGGIKLGSGPLLRAYSSCAKFTAIKKGYQQLP